MPSGLGKVLAEGPLAGKRSGGRSRGKRGSLSLSLCSGRGDLAAVARAPTSRAPLLSGRPGPGGLLLISRGGRTTAPSPQGWRPPPRACSPPTLPRASRPSCRGLRGGVAFMGSHGLQVLERSPPDPLSSFHTNPGAPGSGLNSHPPTRTFTPECDLLWNEGLCRWDSGKDRLRSRWTRVSPKSNDWCPYKTRRGWRHTQKGPCDEEPRGREEERTPPGTCTGTSPVMPRIRPPAWFMKHSPPPRFGQTSQRPRTVTRSSPPPPPPQSLASATPGPGRRPWQRGPDQAHVGRAFKMQ